jgi:hypothetical protein
MMLLMVMMINSTTGNRANIIIDTIDLTITSHRHSQGRINIGAGMKPERMRKISDLLLRHVIVDRETISLLSLVKV